MRNIIIKKIFKKIHFHQNLINHKTNNQNKKCNSKDKYKYLSRFYLLILLIIIHINFENKYKLNKSNINFNQRYIA
jgi:hypothetical protein